jgi:glyoxylase-like metal-dependent hydrolase (beta-lactamase superfamily II)
MKKLICFALSSWAVVGAFAQTQTPAATPAKAPAKVAAKVESAAQVIERAQAAMKGASVNSLAFTASGTGATFGQAYLPTSPWPKITYSNFARHYDYANAAMSEEAARVRAEPNGGGAVPLMGTGEQKTSGRLSGEFAWNMTPAPSASPRDIDGRIHDLWTSPHGVLRAAANYNAIVKKVTLNKQAMTTLGFTVPGRFAAVVYINAKSMVAGVDSVMPSPVLGDTAVTTWYDDYKDFSGVPFPSRIRQEMAGHPMLDVTVSNVQVGTSLDAAVPDAVRNFKENVVASSAVDGNSLGVWFLAGGSHNSALIEMADHAVLVESPLYDGRSLAVLAKAKELLPNKPVRYVINSHHHFDHAGGLRTAASAGLTLVTSSAAKPYFEKALANPNRLHPDALAASSAKWSVEGVSGKRIMTSGARTVEIYEIKDSVHAQGFMMVYLPQEKILIEADAYTPGAPNAPTPAKLNDNNLNLAVNIQANSLQVARFLPLHGRMVDAAEFNRAIGQGQ